MAVCRAEGGKPAANISWIGAGGIVGSDFPQIERDSNGLFTVQSRLKLPEDIDPKNLSCVVNHLYWREERVEVLKLQKGQPFAERKEPFLGFRLVGLRQIIKYSSFSHCRFCFLDSPPYCCFNSCVFSRNFIISTKESVYAVRNFRKLRISD